MLAQLLHNMFLLLVLLLLFLKSSSFTVAAAEVSYCVDKERQALLEIKAQLVDDYGLLSTWSTEVDCCRWRGIQCSNRTGHVIKLDLHVDYPLRGKVSPSLVELRHLKYLDLSFNDFGAQALPKFIGSLTKLKYLDLALSDFTGMIPSQFGNLSNLDYLSISHVDSVENLDWLSCLSRLQHLHMAYVDLSKVNHWVDIVMSLPRLSYLNLEGCNLSQVVLPYCSLINSSSTSITILDLSSNHLGPSMYDWLFNLTSNNLVNLYLAGNQLNCPIPGAFGNLCSLKSLLFYMNNLSCTLQDFLHSFTGCAEATVEELYLSHNQLTGSIPDGIRKFLSLVDLDLSANKLNGTLPENLWKLSKLESLDISSNSINGEVSEIQLSNFPNLSNLDFSFTQLTLQLGSQWVPSFNLFSLNLRSCKIGPHFPQWIKNQGNLFHLDISNGKISDVIPLWFWELTSSMQYLNLSFNLFGGRIPDLSSKFLLSAEIDLSSNKFEGPIPSLPSTLSILNLSRNKFSGSLLFLCQTGDGILSFVDLSLNLLTGELLDCLGNFRWLVVLNLAHNKLSGKIPSDIGSLLMLETLYLFNNSFSGELPLTLRNCSKLKFLDLGENNFSGNIPTWVGKKLPQLYVLSLRSNNFSGTIPLDTCHLTNLRVLDLSRNSFSGNIPACLNNFTYMVQRGQPLEDNYHLYNTTYGSNSYNDYALVAWQGNEREFGKNLGLLKSIDFSGNNLTGEIPDKITDLVELLSLNLSRNNLYGSVPPKIGQMKALVSLDLSRNSLSGGLPTTMSEMTMLGYLDLSYNKLSGRIPSGTQLQGFSTSTYRGNPRLCGPPITSNCPGDETPQVDVIGNGSDQEDRDEFWRWFDIGAGIGFSTGFGVIFGTLVVNRLWRHAFFLVIHNLWDWIYVAVAVRIAKLLTFQRR